MALSTLEAIPQAIEVILDERRPVRPETPHALGATTQKIMELDEAERIRRLSMEDSPYFGHDGISGHGYPMIARDDMTGLLRR